MNRRLIVPIGPERFLSTINSALFSKSALSRLYKYSRKISAPKSAICSHAPAPRHWYKRGRLSPAAFSGSRVNCESSKSGTRVDFTSA